VASGQGGVCLLGQVLARGIVLWLDAKLFHQRQCLVVYRRVVSDHLLGKGAYVAIFRFVQGLLGGLDVKYVGGVGDVGNLRIGGFCRLLGRDGGRGE
jgi:hypothetical protein